MLLTSLDNQCGVLAPNSMFATDTVISFGVKTKFASAVGSQLGTHLDEQGDISFSKLDPRVIFSFSLFHLTLLEGDRAARGNSLLAEKSGENRYPKMHFYVEKM